MIEEKNIFRKGGNNQGSVWDPLGIYLVGKIPEKGGDRGGWKFKNFFCLDRWFRLEGTNDNI